MESRTCRLVKLSPNTTIPYWTYSVQCDAVGYASEVGANEAQWIKCWRAVNEGGRTKTTAARGAVEAEAGERDDEDLGIGAPGWAAAVFDPGEGSSGKLWVFGSNTFDSLQQLQGESDTLQVKKQILIPVDGEERSFDILSTFHCEEHGHDFGCLRPGSQCKLSTASTELAKVWNLLACALAEQLAWLDQRPITTRSKVGYVTNLSHTRDAFLLI